MNNLNNIINVNKAFLIPCMLFWVAGGIFMLFGDKVSIQLFFNQFYHQWQNGIWMFFTFMGDTMFFILTLLIGTLLTYRFSLYSLIMGLTIMILTYVMKQIFDEPRPLTVFTELGIFDQLQTVPGYPLRCCNSFPSGHTISAFAIFGMIAFFAKNNKVKFFVFLMAIGVAYSRVYLMQHFFRDVYAGSIIGVIMVIGTFTVLNRAKLMSELPWMDKSLIKKK